jgi:hypothetical protein
MATRFYICDTIGTGTDEDSYRPAFADTISVPWAADDLRDDSTTSGKLIVWADVTDEQHTIINAVPGVTYLPLESNGVPLDLNSPISQLSNLSQLRTALENRHIPTSDLTLEDPIKKVIARIIRRIRVKRALQRRVNNVLDNADFAEGLDTTISQVPAQRRQKINTWLQEKGFDTSVLKASDTIREALQKLAVQDIKTLKNNWD